MPLVTRPNFHDPTKISFYGYTPGDDFYEALISAHVGQTAAQSHAFNARLVLILANHIGDLDVLREALSAAANSSPEAN
ncbi:MAG: hypothetical protein RLZZ344_527 [Pseudomonadota bacterium]|jgi:hypothetical protein